MHAYRTHTCGALRATDAGQTARLSGWVHAKRDHGGLLFIDCAIITASRNACFPPARLPSLRPTRCGRRA